MSVVVSLEWRTKACLLHSAIISSFQEAKCYNPDTLTEVFCPQCQPAAGFISVQPLLHTPTLDALTQTECFRFNVGLKCAHPCAAPRPGAQQTGTKTVVLGFHVNYMTVFSPPVQVEGCTLEENTRNSTLADGSCSSADSSPAAWTPIARTGTPMDSRTSTPVCSSPEESSALLSPGEDRSALAVLSPLIRSPKTMPLCVILRVMRHHVSLSPEQWQVMNHTGFEHLQMNNLSSYSKPLSFKSITLPNSTAYTIMGLKQSRPDTESWYSLHVACYPSKDVAQLSSSAYELELLRALGVNTRAKDPASRILLTLCNSL
eukprot:TRINITY_DN3259_c0_g1_i1.p1 TRINITY_DN3259_c0_g1~~TRINITY_DN3259_c0_g1_i1.p1  ORF type:complete len:317 (-),score=62.24 TRINITY_DN3259_c0_g1_i1:46-996(-)